MDAGEYKHVVLGLIFLKYISDSFEEKYDSLKNDKLSDPEDRDEYLQDNIFWVPKKSRWDLIKKIIDTYHAWRGENEGVEYKDIPGFCKAVKLDEIKEHEYILTPGRYVGIEEAEADSEPFEDKMERLTEKLAEQFIKGKELEDEIRKNLADIGWEI